MKPFLEKIAKRLLLKFPTNMRNVAVVLPTKRSVVFLKKYLSLNINKPIFLPRFYTIEEFIEEISTLNILDNISLQFYLYQAYLNTSPLNKDSFDDFLKWSNMLLHDYNDIDSSMVSPETLFNNLKDVKELENWQINEWSFSNSDLSDHQKSFINFFESLLPIYNEFKRILSHNNCAYQGLANRVAAENIKTKNIIWDKVWFVGLNALTHAEHVIIDNLKQKDIARVFWDADKYYFNESNHEAGLFLKKQQLKWNEVDFVGVGDYLSKPKEKIQVISCPNSNSQVQVMKQVLSSQSNKLDNGKTAIILADESLLYPALNNMPDEVDKLNVTMGSPFEDTPFYSFIDSIINMHLSSEKYNSKGFYFEDLFKLLDHSYLAKILSAKNIFRLKNQIINENISFVPLDIILRILDDEVVLIFKKWLSVKDFINGLDTIVDLMRNNLIGKKATLDSEILNTFYKIIRRFEVLTNTFSFKIELKATYLIFKQLISKEIIPFKGEPLEGVQLMGILESRTLDFDNLIILGVNEGFLPKGKSVNSFIPFDLRKYFKIPTYNDRDAVFAYHFYRLLQRSQHITLTYNTQTDDFGSGEKSRFITQLLNEYKSNPISEFTYQNNQLDILKENILTIRNENMNSEIHKWALSGVSPSAISKYINCNLDFYFHYLVKIREDNEVDEFADNSLMGNAIHDSLKNHYPKGVLDSRTLNSAHADIMSSIQSHYKEKLPPETYNKGKNLLSLSIAEKLTNDFLKFETGFINKNSKLTILLKEEVLNHQINIDGFMCNLTGQVDRVDFVNDSLRIIDYKTGKAVTKKDLVFNSWEDLTLNPDKKFLFQILMYTYLFLKKNPEYINKNIDAGIFSFRNLDEGLILVNTQDQFNFNYDFLDLFEKHLKTLLRKIFNDDFIANGNSEKNCKYCNHNHIN
tara:strand:- start:2352 stop:5105 length:2754 start_codon:yes stop_codon:yes gene_type:complete